MMVEIKSPIRKCFDPAWFLTLLLLAFSFQCENPEEIPLGKNDPRVGIILRECADAAINTNNLFAVCGAGSVDDPFRVLSMKFN